MKTAIASIVMASLSLVGAEWEDTSVNSINRRPAHFYAMPLASEKDAFFDAVDVESPYVKSLNGMWKISWCGDPVRRPMDFYKTDFDDSAWQEIDVPSCVEMRGFGVPGYTNVTYPHKKTPPYIRDFIFNSPDYNPVSSYRTSFAVPAEWKGRRIVLRFNGVYSAYYIWVNGEKVGYAEDSKLPSEFDITPYLKGYGADSPNTLAVQVFRWCDGSYLEDQDMFRFSGIFRDVQLVAEPMKAIEDVYVRSELDADYRNAKVKVSVKTQGGDPSVDLYDADYRKVASGFGNEVALDLPGANLWSAEKPYLYTLVVKSGDDIRSLKVGVKTIEKKGNTVLVNGRKLKFKGVNRHEHSAKNGRTVSKEEMLADIRLMKRYNINTVRTCHYPDAPMWYDLCDKYGLYLVAEANVEGHAMGYGKEGLGLNPSFESTIVERNVNHVLNYRDHPSVTIWSLGNETGHGPNFVKAAEGVRANDPTRIIHWERGLKDVDVDSAMYSSVEWLYNRGKIGDGLADPDPKSEHTKGKPFFMCEYAHSMGNALGNFQEYWDAFYSSDSLLGGCIWDWVDQALEKKTGRYDANGKPITVLAYGGDYDEKPNDGPFCCNGVIRPDRQVTAKLIEVGHVYRQLVLSSADASTLKAELWNRFSFTDADEFQAKWELVEDGFQVADGSFDVPSVKPYERKIIDLPKPDCEIKPGAEYFYNVSFILKKSTDWAEKGHVISRNQMPWANGAKVAENKAGLGKYKPDVGIHDKTIVVMCHGSYRAEFCRKTGELLKLYIRGTDVLDERIGADAGPHLTWMRAFVDNDNWIRDHWGDNTPLVDYGLTQWSYQPKGVNVEKADGVVKIHVATDVTTAKSAGFIHNVTWVFKRDGKIAMENKIEPYGRMPKALPRIGLSWKLNGALENMQWYGRGPWENYVDRNTGSFIGFYESTVTKQYERYVRPQDNGYKSDVRWVRFSTKKDHGVKFSASVPMFVQALHYDWEDLNDARHINYERRRDCMKPPREEICLNLDVRQLGLGGASCGPRPMDKYIFPIEPISWTLYIE